MQQTSSTEGHSQVTAFHYLYTDFNPHPWVPAKPSPFREVCCGLQASQGFSAVFGAKVALAPGAHFNLSSTSMPVSLPSLTDPQAQLFGREGLFGLTVLEASVHTPFFSFLKAEVTHHGQSILQNKTTHFTTREQKEETGQERG